MLTVEGNFQLQGIFLLIILIHPSSNEVHKKS